MYKVRTITAEEVEERIYSEVAPLPCQKEYVKQLSALVAFHIQKNLLMDSGFSASQLPSQGAIVVAPTGTGKTFLLDAIKKTLSVNTITIDASIICREGWKGMSLGRLLLSSYEECEDAEEWERSIVFFDEADKLRLYGDYHDEGNPIDNLLSLYNQTSIVVEDENHRPKRLNVNRFTIILGGAFDGIEEIVKSRISPNRIGFAPTSGEPKYLTKAELMKRVTMADIKKYGFKQELLGRISSILSIDPMGLPDYKCLLTSDTGSILKRYQNYFGMGAGIDFSLDDTAVEYVAKKCTESEAGARAVSPLVNDAMRRSFADVDRDPTINKVVLKANENGCYLEYGHGEREIPILAVTEPSEEKGSGYYIHGASPEELTEKLLKVYAQNKYRRADKAELRAFLNLTLTYIQHCCNISDHRFSSLVKLADTLKGSRIPSFDTIVEREFKNVGQKLEDLYGVFSLVRNDETFVHLGVDLMAIWNVAQRKYHASEIYFEFIESEDK